MACPGAETIVNFVAGALEARQAEELERHLDSCAPCRKLAATQKAVWSSLDGWPAGAVPGDFDERLFARIEADGRQKWWHFPNIPGAFGFPTAAPVAVACLALVGAFYYSMPDADRGKAAPVAVEQRVDVEQVERTLDDLEMLKQMTAPAPGESSESES